MCSSDLVVKPLNERIEDSAGLAWEGDVELLMGSDVDGLGLCCCGEPERVVRMMADYLNHRNPDYPTIVNTDGSDAQMLLAYLADKCGLTEHGGTVYGAWLTDEGKRWLARAAALGAE